MVFVIEPHAGATDSYPVQGFRGFVTDAYGKLMRAVLQPPAGDGDATVALSSGRALNRPSKGSDPVSGEDPGDRELRIDHQAAYQDELAQRYTVQAIIAMCKKYIKQNRSG